MSPPRQGTSSSQPPSKKKKLGRTSVHDEYTRGKGAGKRGEEKDGCYCNVCGEFFMSRNPTTLKNHLQAFHGEVYSKVVGMFKSITYYRIKKVVSKLPSS